MSPLIHTLHFFCAAYMTGIIWFVQLVHYPMLHHTDGSDGPKGHQEYTRRMGFVVMPVMLLELGLQIFWTATTPTLMSWTGAMLLAVVWASTFFLQVPEHNTLSNAFSPEAQRRLVRGNWIRTAAWTARACLLGYLVGVM